MKKRTLPPSFLLGGLILFFGSALTGCDSAEPKKADATQMTSNPTDLPYAVWPSREKMTGYELSNLIRQDEGVADLLCNNDFNAPQGYNKHFALISTPNQDRADLAKKYSLNPAIPVTFGATGKILADNLGDFLAQKGQVDPKNAAGKEMIKLTFSKEGRFAGLCKSPSDYTSVINILSEDGKMFPLVTRCDQPAVTVCMSIR